MRAPHNSAISNKSSKSRNKPSHARSLASHRYVIETARPRGDIARSLVVPVKFLRLPPRAPTGDRRRFFTSRVKEMHPSLFRFPSESSRFLRSKEYSTNDSPAPAKLRHACKLSRERSRAPRERRSSRRCKSRTPGLQLRTPLHSRIA